MEYKLIDDKLQITLPQKIYEGNASQVDKELQEIITNEEGHQVILDCADLNYISSSGLRVLLSAQKMLQKMYKSQGSSSALAEREGDDSGIITLKNISKDVNEILEATGFDNIFRVIRKLKRIDISGLEQISSGINGTFYKLGHDMMIKVYRRGTSLDDVEREREMSRKALACGIPTVISFSVAETNEGTYGIIFENVKGNSLARVIRNNPKDWFAYAVKLGKFVRSLHEIEILPGTLPDIKARYHKWLDAASEKMRSHGETATQKEGELASVAAQAGNRDVAVHKEQSGRDRVDSNELESMRNLVDSMSDANTFIHGDINLNSIFLVHDELLLMDMASCGYGHPVFDLQGLYASLVAIEIDEPGYCETHFGIPPKQCRNIWNAFLMEYMGAEPGLTKDELVMGDENKIDLIKSKKLNQLLTQYYILKERLIDSI